MGLAVLGLAYRVFDLAILDQRFLRQQGDERVLRLVNTPTLRGIIVDRNKFPLAVSTKVFSVWMNPKEFIPTKKELALLSPLLDIKTKELVGLIHQYQNKKREFVYLKRGLSPEVTHEIKALGLTGLYFQQAYRRYYPEGEITAHVAGFTNIDDHGQEGLELAYDTWLRGEPGKKWVIKDRMGRVISDVKTVSEQEPGKSLVLSLDRRIQYLAYRELLKGVLQYHATSGSAVVLDVQTGEVLAMVNQPSFNPNYRPLSMNETIRNRAVTDTFEPGSTIKAFTIASALESGRLKPDAIIDTSEKLRVGRLIVKDGHKKLSLAQILQLSSNLGAARIGLNLPPNKFWTILHGVGFGEASGLAFPGEQVGTLMEKDPWGASTPLAYGYGLSVTTLQLARAYAVLASGGIKKPVSLLRLERSPEGERVLSEKVAKEMLILLESVIIEGTGKSASVPGYRVGGKTGTAWLVGKEGYQKHRYNAVFVGIAPLSSPRLVVAVILHDPQGKNYHGGQVSGPIFAKIMEGTLRVLDIPPDSINKGILNQ